MRMSSFTARKPSVLSPDLKLFDEIPLYPYGFGMSQNLNLLLALALLLSAAAGF